MAWKNMEVDPWLVIAPLIWWTLWIATMEVSILSSFFFFFQKEQKVGEGPMISWSQTSNRPGIHHPGVTHHFKVMDCSTMGSTCMKGHITDRKNLASVGANCHYFHILILVVVLNESNVYGSRPMSWIYKKVGLLLVAGPPPRWLGLNPATRNLASEKKHVPLFKDAK